MSNYSWWTATWPLLFFKYHFNLYGVQNQKTLTRRKLISVFLSYCLSKSRYPWKLLLDHLNPVALCHQPYAAFYQLQTKLQHSNPKQSLEPFFLQKVQETYLWYADRYHRLPYNNFHEFLSPIKRIKTQNKTSLHIISSIKKHSDVHAQLLQDWEMKNRIQNSGHSIFFNCRKRAFTLQNNSNIYA